MSERERLVSVTKKDLVIEHFRAGGKGGQKQNKTSSGSRVRHPASGAVGESREERSQPQNTKLAFQRMTQTEEFQRWLKLETARANGRLAESEVAVERAMQPKNLRVEVKDEDGRWVQAEE